MRGQYAHRAFTFAASKLSSTAAPHEPGTPKVCLNTECARLLLTCLPTLAKVAFHDTIPSHTLGQHTPAMLETNRGIGACNETCVQCSQQLLVSKSAKPAPPSPDAEHEHQHLTRSQGELQLPGVKVERVVFLGLPKKTSFKAKLPGGKVGGGGGRHSLHSHVLLCLDHGLAWLGLGMAE